MRRTRLYKSHRCLPAFFFAAFTRIAFFFFISTVICSVSFLFAPPPTAFSQEIVTIQINGSAQPPGFTPALLTLHVNETVMFINHAFPAKSYTLHADDGSFSSPAIPTGGSWTITFRTPGSHTYRDPSAAQTMVGELLVVNKGISLLATPNPFVEATVTALIKNGQNPPDTIIIATPKRAIPPSNSLIPLVILVVGISISVTLLAILGISYYKRYRQRVAVSGTKDGDDVIPNIDDEDDEDDATLDDEDDEDSTNNHARIQQIRSGIDNLKQKIQVRSHLLRRKTHDEDDDEDDED